MIHSCAEAAAHQRANLLALLALACRWREARTPARLAHLLQQESVSCKDGAYGEWRHIGGANAVPIYLLSVVDSELSGQRCPIEQRLEEPALKARHGCRLGVEPLEPGFLGRT